MSTSWMYVETAPSAFSLRKNWRETVPVAPAARRNRADVH